MAEDRVTIVVVDDDEGHIELLRRNLRRAGIHNPLEALYSGEAALDYVYRRGHHEGRPQTRLIILLDINMPGGLDGLEVLRRIKEDLQTRRIPVLMLTTADDPHEIDRCYDLGCNAYLTKPVDPTTFGEAIEHVAQMVSVARLPSAARLPA
jgi:CheY-like chemotaxis protein